MSEADAVVVRSIVSLVWYPEIKSLTADALDAIVESVVDGDAAFPAFIESANTRPLNWMEQAKFVFEAAAFVKTCIEIYNAAPNFEDARAKVAAISIGASKAIKGVTSKVVAAIESWTPAPDNNQT